MSENEHQATPEQILQGKKVLLIEDTPNTRKNIQNIFQLVNLEITTVNDGQQALNLLAKQPDFDLIITDLDMPVLNGVKFLKKIVNDPTITTCKSFILQTSSMPDSLPKHLEKLNNQAAEKNTGITIQWFTKDIRIPKFLSTVADAVK